jgi:acetylornithine deacetylase/succinyl-diaminopimelate desuccinylase-like protein
MNFRVLIVFAAIAVSVAMQAQSSQRAALAVRQWRNAHETEILQQFTTLLSIPNVASDRENIQRNAELLKSMLQKRGVDSRLLTVEGVNPVVFGEIKTPNAKDTIVFYAHYDGQPVTPSEWEGNTPFTPVIRKVNGEDRIFARSASDDKGAIMAQLAALDALRAAQIPFRSNIRFIWEGEEEAGSPHLEAILNRARLELRHA